MDVREKLVELLGKAKHEFWCSREKYNGTEFVADYLIAHGVTVQEWISVDEPPKEKGIYQVFLRDKEMERTKVWYGQFTGCNWSVYDIYGDWMWCEVTHWMHLPDAPKGE